MAIACGVCSASRADTRWKHCGDATDTARPYHPPMASVGGSSAAGEDPASMGARRRDRPNVVLLHDASRAASTLADDLADSSYDVTSAAITRSTVDHLLVARPDTVIVDLDGARFDVVRLCAAVRDAMPVRLAIVSSAALSDDVVIAALDAGADDVVVGASPEVIDARIRAALRTQPVR